MAARNARTTVTQVPEAPKKRGRPRAFDLDAVAGKAALLFWARGYEGVSVDELTKAMGITTQSFYSAFGSKEKLHRDALSWYDREVTRRVRDALNGENGVFEAVRAALRVSAREFTRSGRPAGCMRSMAGICASRESEAVVQHAIALRAETVAALKARLDQGISDGQLARRTDTRAWAVYLNAMVVGMSVAAHDGATTNDLLALAEMAAASLPTRRKEE